jgi:DNA polymerase III epsilon subunit-like protein
MKKTYIHIDVSGDCFENDRIISISGMKVDMHNNIQDYFYEDIPAYTSPTLNQKYYFQNCKTDNLFISNTFRDKLTEFKNFIIGTVVISHYKYYEIEFLRRALKTAGLDMIKNDWIDLQENIIVQNDFGGDIFDVAKKFKVDLGANKNFFFVNESIVDIHHRMMN